jgi:hypothetical protein
VIVIPIHFIGTGFWSLAASARIPMSSRLEEMSDELTITGCRRAGHRARRNAQCFEVGTVADPTIT